MSGLRVFPNMDVMRPADPEETAAAYAAALDRKDGPTALILTRQNVRTLKEIPVRRLGNFSLFLGSAWFLCWRKVKEERVLLVRCVSCVADSVESHRSIASQLVVRGDGAWEESVGVECCWWRAVVCVPMLVRERDQRLFRNGMRFCCV